MRRPPPSDPGNGHWAPRLCRLPVAVAVGLAALMLAGVLITAVLAWPEGRRPSARVLSTEPRREGVDVTTAQLRRVTLDATDLGIPETAGGSPMATDLVTLADLDGDPDCLARLAALQERDAGLRFGGGPIAAPRRSAVELSTRDIQLDHEVAAGVDVRIADYRDLFRVCDRVAFQTPGGRSGSMTFELGRFPSIGDDSLSLHYDLEVEGTVQEVEWVVWEREGIISSVSLCEVPRHSRGLDRFLLEAAIERADAKLEEMLR